MMEWQFDGLVGPTHNYAGLAKGNLASARNANAISNPRAAALQGLQKMKFVQSLGVPQAFLPPHYRPLVGELRRIGFSGSLSTILDSAARTSPELLAAVYSSAFMWTANAATVTPSTDAADGRLHLTVANLQSHYHRSLEPQFTKHCLETIFHNKNYFNVHSALPSTALFGDEGAANHMKVQNNIVSVSNDIFVYGSSEDRSLKTQLFLPRQHRNAFEAVARLHGLTPARTHFFQQSPDVIDQGVFHNDVIALNTTSRMVIHEKALIPEHQAQLKRLFAARPGFMLHEVLSETLSVADAVNTYLFNSQLIELAGGRFVLIAPVECADHAAVQKVIAQLMGSGLLDDVHYLDVRESMRNGGGPACLRLRVVMNPEQSENMHQGVVLTESKYSQLCEWVQTHYRDRLSFDDFRDPEFVFELERAYDALEGIVDMGGLYDPWRMSVS